MSDFIMEAEVCEEAICGDSHVLSELLGDLRTSSLFTQRGRSVGDTLAWEVFDKWNSGLEDKEEELKRCVEQAGVWVKIAEDVLVTREVERQQEFIGVRRRRARKAQ